MSTTPSKPTTSITLIPGGLMGVLTIILVCAKLWGPLTATSWWLILLPAYLGIAIVLAFVLALFEGK